MMHERESEVEVEGERESTEKPMIKTAFAVCVCTIVR